MMLELDEEDLDKLAEYLTIKDEQGRAMLKIGWVVRIFFAEPWTKPVREAVSAAAEEYIQMTREHLRWARQPRTGHMHPIGTGRVKFPWEWVPQHDDEEKSWNFGFHGGEGDEDASSFLIDALGREKTRGGPGYFEVYLPLTWFANHAGTFQGFVLDLAKRLHPLSGYGAIGVQAPQDADGMQRSMYLVRQLADRFPGIDIGDVISERLIFADSMDRAECIKGPSWLTLLSDPYVNELGGLDYLRMRLGDDFSVTTYEGGVMIQAGSKPEIGDVQQNRWPRHLITLSKVLRPLRFKEPFAIHGYTYKDHPTMDLKTTEAWMARFDDK